MKKNNYLYDVFHGTTKFEALNRLEQRVGHFFKFEDRVGEEIPSKHSNYQYAYVAEKWRRKAKQEGRDRIPIRMPFWRVRLFKVPKGDIVEFRQHDRTFTLVTKYDEGEK